MGDKSAAELVHIGGLGKSYIHVGAAFEINPVAKTAIDDNRSPPGEEKNAAQGIEILGLAHPVDVGLFEELDHAYLLPFLRLQGVAECSRRETVYLR